MLQRLREVYSTGYVASSVEADPLVDWLAITITEQLRMDIGTRKHPVLRMAQEPQVRQVKQAQRD